MGLAAKASAGAQTANNDRKQVRLNRIDRTPLRVADSVARFAGKGKGIGGVRGFPPFAARRMGHPTKHLEAYIEEMQFRFNRRGRSDLFVDILRHMVAADPLTFAQLTTNY